MWLLRSSYDYRTNKEVHRRHGENPHSLSLDQEVGTCMLDSFNKDGVRGPYRRRTHLSRNYPKSTDLWPLWCWVLTRLTKRMKSPSSMTIDPHRRRSGLLELNAIFIIRYKEGSPWTSQHVKTMWPIPGGLSVTPRSGQVHVGASSGCAMLRGVTKVKRPFATPCRNTDPAISWSIIRISLILRRKDFGIEWDISIIMCEWKYETEGFITRAIFLQLPMALTTFHFSHALITCANSHDGQWAVALGLLSPYIQM